VGEAHDYIGEWIEGIEDPLVPGPTGSSIPLVHHVTFTLPKFRPIVERAPGRLLHPQASTIARGRNTAQALLKSIEEIREFSNEEQVSNKQLQALCKRVAKQEEYTILL
jgi:hypothetical protein